MDKENVRACIICLEMDGTLYNLHSGSLERYYELLTGIDPLKHLELPMFVCYVCKAMLHKFYLFRQRSLRGQAILQGIFQRHGKIIEEDIREVDKNSYLLSSNLSIHYPEDIKMIKEEDANETIKQEPDEILDYDFTLETNHDNDWPSDDEPLSIHKSRKMEGNLDVMEMNVEGEVKTEEVEEKPSKASKTKKSKKVSQPKAVRQRSDTLKAVILRKGSIDDMDLETYVTVVNLTEEEQLEEIRKRQETDNYKNAAFKCELCFKGFLDTQTWQHHLQRHDKVSGSIECNICKLRFKTARVLNKHVIGHAKKFICNYCPYVSRHTTQAKHHLFWHQGVMYKCPYCEEVLSKWTSYLSHVRIKHPSDYICGFCGYSFVSQLGLSQHKTIMHKDLTEAASGADPNEAPYCEACDVKFSSAEAFKRHMVTAKRHNQEAENKNGCRKCGESFKTDEELRAHVRYAHTRKWSRTYKKKTDNRTWPTNCPHCSEEIGNARAYWAHFRKYHPDKEYPIEKGHICDVCGKAFTGNAFLVYHKRTHSAVKAFKCGECGKAFHNRANLLMHAAAHSERRPHVCCACGKAFKSKGALDRHFRSHTGDKPYKCEVCGKAFAQSNSCKLHVRTVHLKQPSPYLSRARLDRRKPTEQTMY
ncbi:zinc finger protein 846-like [Zerene cesonia]|uniref:zinc finger protein 846-like n=1 Tax=Zerene cesonia TaxID=33412 RepID=UPI0018E55853|nr:zinc finger protein 846-like [Zerene cesonia]